MISKSIYFLLLVSMLACKPSKQVADAASAYDLKQYALAAQYYEQDYNSSRRDEDRAFYAYRLGQCYESINDVRLSLKWYQKATEYAYGPEAEVRYAYALKSNGKYTQAAALFDHLFKRFGHIPLYRDEAAKSLQAARWTKQQTSITTEVKSLPINTDASEYSPIVLSAGKLLFTSDRNESQGRDIYQWTGHKFSDLFIYDVLSGQVKPFIAPFNSEQNDGAAISNSVGDELYFTRCFDPDPDTDNFCKIYRVVKKDNKWGRAEILPFQKSNVNYGHPVLYKSDSLLIYSANDPAGYGGYDLFAVLRDSSGWSEPFILDAQINTDGNEKFPTAYKDTLYFSSDKITGMGGLDIFKTYLKAGGQWAKPINLQAPINSGADDFGLSIDPIASQRAGVMQAGYFSSSRHTGLGRDDLYSFTQTIDNSQFIDTITNDNLEDDITYLYYLAGYVYEQIRENPSDPASAIIATKKMIDANVEIRSGDQAISVKTNKDGRFLEPIALGKNYRISAKKENYLKAAISFSTMDVSNDPLKSVVTFNVKIGLDQIIRGQEITLDNIYYDFDKSYIRSDAMPTLNALANILRNNPELTIRLGSHTDCQGLDDYNLELSQRRAEAAMNFLISKGIDPARLKSRGYGETRLIMTCVCDDCTDDQHQINRRTTFEILE